MSFRDQPRHGSWPHIGCFVLGFFLLVGNGVFLANWYLTYWDLSTDTYRPLVPADLIVPIVLIASATLLWLYVRWMRRDRD